MIEKFGVITRTGELLESCLRLNTNMYNNTKDEISLRFFNTKGNGIYWISEGKEISIFSNSGNIIGYPSSDLIFIVAVYHPVNNYDFSAPHNAVIYNADGSIYLQLKQQKLISDFAKKSKLKPSELFFDEVGWSKDCKGDVVTAITIGFNRDFREERVLNTKTGELGELLSSGMY